MIVSRLQGRPVSPFRYKHPGSMATIGRSHAIAEVGKIKLWGYLAWLAWLFIHLINLIQFTNRLLVLIQWSWNYFTRNRAARLITGEHRLPGVIEGQDDRTGTQEAIEQESRRTPLR